MSATLPSFRGFSHAAKALTLVACGVGALARKHFLGQGCVLTFHGLYSDDSPPGISDESLHLPAPSFRAVCRYLATHCRVMPLEELLLLLCRTHEPLPTGAVAITFDDGYASNFHLAFPILQEFKLPATIFLTTAFLDGEDRLWFQRVDRALRGGSSEQLAAKLAELKALPDPEMRRQVEQLDSVEAAKAHRSEELPAVMRPMTWDQARQMRDSGWITFGGHTHTHPILARCTVEHQRREIETCRDRIKAELGAPPRTFAFPNGGADDYTADTLAILRRAGFDLACTMVNGRVGPDSRVLELPRYGSPASAWEAEATVSGAFELSKEWRQRGLRVLGGLK